jgi:uncharacterized protein YraI
MPISDMTELGVVMRYLRFGWMLVLLISLAACNLTTDPPTEEPLETEPTIEQSGRPAVTIASPSEGDEVVVGTQIFVNANATDSVGVTRVQLIANNQIVKTVSSESPAGQRTFEVLLDYTPRQVGEVNLQVVAFRGAIASDPAEVNITIQQTAQQVQVTIAPADNAPVIDPNDPTCRALTNTGLNLRGGPNTSFNRITVIPAGEIARIVGRLSDNTWWQVQYGVNVGWVSSQYTTTYGICSNIPVVAAPPTATPTGGTPTRAPTATPLAPTSTPVPGRADLVITNVAGPTSTRVSSSPVTYSVTISNTGNGPSGQFSNRVTLPNGTPADLGTVSNLNPGESIVLNIQIEFTNVQTYQLQAQADSSGQVNEISEFNNTGSLTVTIS